MELNVQEQVAKIKAEMEQLVESANQIQAQINQLTTQKQELINGIIKKQGALDLLNNLNGKKPEKRK